MNEEMMSKNDWKWTMKENWHTEVTLNLMFCTKAPGDNMKMNEHGCVSMKLYQKLTAACRLWTPELCYTCNRTIKLGFHKTNEIPLLFLKKFPPSPNRSVWTFPTEGATLIEQTCGGGSVCSKVCKFLTTTKIMFVQQITVVFPMCSQTIPKMVSLVFQHQL